MTPIPPSPHISYALCNLYFWVVRGSKLVKYFARDHNTTTNHIARFQTQISGTLSIQNVKQLIKQSGNLYAKADTLKRQFNLGKVNYFCHDCNCFLLFSTHRGIFYTVYLSKGFRIISINMNYCNNMNWYVNCLSAQTMYLCVVFICCVI